ncbi:MAG: ribonuclease T2 [Hyphomicrobiaceae bacterium]
MISRRAGIAIAAFSLLTIGAVSALAQFGLGPGGRAPYSRQAPPRNEAGRFDYYAMVMSWSPTYCATSQRAGSERQCQYGRPDRPYAFVLDGLWPQHERGWPESCPTRDRPFVPQRTIDRMLDIMPSSGLVIHEFRKHGTCSGLDADAYFALSRKLFEKVRVPPRYVRPNQVLSVSPGEIVRDFMQANPGMKPDSIAVSCGGQGNRLRELRVCFAKDGAYRSCGANENQRRLCSAARVQIPPVRAGGPVQPRRGHSGPGERRI